MVTLESLPLIRVWLDAEQLAVTARIVMDGHKVPAIGVVDSHRNLVGWVTAIELVGSTSETKLSEIMVPAPAPVASSLTIREAASELIKRDVDCLPVIDHEKFSTVVTSRSLLGKLRESYDPMTQLPWSDALREWGIDQLEKGTEIVILFVDLNNFGKFNKQFGHVVGDRVIQTVASHLRSKIDLKTEVLVRYGGDEFAIGTSRDRDEAEELMASIEGEGNGLVVAGIDPPITFSVGIYGGRRTKTRNDVHGASNLDNLVNLASRNCLAKKEVLPEPATVPPGVDAESIPLSDEIEPDQKTGSVYSERVTRSAEPDVSSTPGSLAKGAPGVVGDSPVASAAVSSPSETEVTPQSPPFIETIQADDEPNSLTYVVVRSGDRQYVGTSVKMGHSKDESIAYATAKALEKAFPAIRVTVDSVTVERAGSTELVTTRVRTVRNNLERDVTAQAEANGDLEDTIGLAVISAVLAE